MKAWYFSRLDKRLRYGDNRLIRTGVKMRPLWGDGSRVKPSEYEELELCSAGLLHASIRPLDALAYAPGPYVWRVEVSGFVVEGPDKLGGTERTALWGYDATEVLRKFARLCALDVIHLWDAPEIVVRYLRTGDESIRAAAGDAAWDAASDAARVAAGAAARDVPRAAVRAAARAAARYVARAAARDTQNKRLDRMLREGRPR